MKIAVISMIRTPWGGSEELWYEMARIAIPQGITIIHLSYENKVTHPKITALQNMGMIELTRPGFVNPDAGKLTRFVQITLNYFRKKIDNPFHKVFSYKPDIVLYNGTCYSIENEKQLLQLIQQKQVPFYIIGHLNTEGETAISDESRNTLKRAYALCKKVFFVSQRNLDVAKKQLGEQISNSGIIRNPVNLKDISVVEYPRNPTVNFAMIGNLSVIHKGQDVVLTILGNDAWRDKDWQLNIYGTGIDEVYLKSLAIRLKISEKVIFHGHTNDIRHIWSCNHLLLMPSLMEGMPLVIVEAMLCGRTCVATDTGGITEWVEDGKSGFIAKERTAASFENALNNAWSHRESWTDFGQAAHVRALELYDPNAGTTLLNRIISIK